MVSGLDSKLDPPEDAVSACYGDAMAVGSGATVTGPGSRAGCGGLCDPDYGEPDQEQCPPHSRLQEPDERSEWNAGYATSPGPGSPAR